MKKSTLWRLCLFFAVALFELPLMAQGVVVWKKDGTQVKFAYEEIDSIVTYNVGEDVEADSIDPRAVDLGLSVKWASCNVGATSPWESGCYFNWGAIDENSSFRAYLLSTSELDSLGIIGADGNLTAAYDAATVSWGIDWRMPTEEEMKELRDKCSWEWATMSGVNGCKVTGPNGNSVFFPITGHRDYYFYFHNSTSSGGYWSATPKNDDSRAYILSFSLVEDSLSLRGGYSYRYNGYPVRPVTE